MFLGQTDMLITCEEGRISHTIGEELERVPVGFLTDILCRTKDRRPPTPCTDMRGEVSLCFVQAMCAGALLRIVPIENHP